MSINSVNTIEVRWKNFRGFEDTDWIKIKPLTVLIGSNNSGKTSFLAPLLLLKQSVLTDDPSNSLKTKGELINVGSFEDIAFNHDKSRVISFSIRYHTHNKPKGPAMPPVGKAMPGLVELDFAWDEELAEITLKKYKVSDMFERHMVTRNLLKSGKYSLLGVENASAFSKSVLKDKSFDDALRKNIRNSIPYNYLFNDSPFGKTLVERKTTERGVEISEYSRIYLKVVEHVGQTIYELLNKINYVGPLRERPKRFYELSGEMPESVGNRGEFAPEIIYRLRETGFIEEIEEWLHKFDFKVNLKARILSEGVFDISLRKGRNTLPTNFADTGFGLSQVLPLVVQGLYSINEKEVIIAEQPEIHLNPKLQSTLANLFCEIAMSGPRVVIETHSEHLILRLRRLVAEGVFPANKVALYYVEKVNNKSQIREVPIKQNGHIEYDDWPSGFFGDSLKDSLSLATAQMRRKNDA